MNGGRGDIPRAKCVRDRIGDGGFEDDAEGDALGDVEIDIGEVEAPDDGALEGEVLADAAQEFADVFAHIDGGGSRRGGEEFFVCE